MTYSGFKHSQLDLVEVSHEDLHIQFTTVKTGQLSFC